MPDFETQVIHAGIEPDPLTGAVMTPIYQSSTFAQAAPGETKGYEYSRSDNPTRTPLQTQLAALENGATGLVYSSGLAAIDSVLNLLTAGDHVVAGNDLYGGTYRLFTKVATYRGIEFTFVDASSEESVRAAMRPTTKLVWCETPTNPMLSIVDIAMIAKVARENSAISVVDNTFMSPYFQRPLDLGADVVMHSMTKFLNGHSDVVMGCLVVSKSANEVFGSDLRGSRIAEKLKFLQNSVGATPGPFECFLVLRGIKTLAVRMQRHAENAAKVARFLESHPKVERVLYPGSASHPGHDLARRQASGFGGMVTMQVRGGLTETRRFLSSVKVFTLAESLGGVESLIEHPAIMTHASVPAENRAALGIHDNLVRCSVGLESANDLIADLDRALAFV